MSFFAAPGLGGGGGGGAFGIFAAAAPASTTSPSSSPPLSASTTPGLFLEEDEEHERRTMALEELAGSRADVYGTVQVRDRSPEEIDVALRAMDEALRSSVAPSRRRWLDEAKERCPDQVNDEKKAMFLWRTDFDAKLAAERLVDYWEFKHSLFGDEKCYLPMTLSGALRDDIGTLSAGIFQIIPMKDCSGRAMMFFEPSRRDFGKHSKESVLRAFWYVYHCVLEDLEIQKRGIVWISYVKKASPKQFDIQLYPAIMDLEKKYVPILIRAFHICHPDPFFRAISPIAKHLLGRHLRPRTGIHHGTEQAVLEKLVDFGITPSRVPTDMGGSLVMDVTSWLCDRLSLEKERDAVAVTVWGKGRNGVAAEQTPEAGAAGMTTAGKVFQDALTDDGARLVKRRRDEQVREGDDSAILTRSVPNQVPLLAQALNGQAFNGLQHSPLHGVVPAVGKPVVNISPLNPNSHHSGKVDAKAVPVATATYQSLLSGTLRSLQDQADRDRFVQRVVGTLPSSNSCINSSAVAASSKNALLFRLLMAQAGVNGRARDDSKTIQALQLLSSVNGSGSFTGACRPTPHILSSTAESTDDLALQHLHHRLHLANGATALNNSGLAGVSYATSNVSSNYSSVAKASLLAGLPPQQQPAVAMPSVLGNCQSLNVPQQALLRSPPLNASPSAAKPALANVCCLLYIPQDEDKISSHQCLIRKQIEAFVATEDHVQSHARGRNKAVKLGQVGIRCRHCKGLPLHSSQRGSIYFPASLVHLYQAAVNMSGFHLANSEKWCKSMPEEVKEQFRRSKPSKSTVGGGKNYWAEAGRAIGLVETPHGLVFSR